MSERKSNCEDCGAIGTLVKLPSRFFSLDKNIIKRRVGDLVRESIEEFREELNLEKDIMENEFFEPDE
jgi:hypothetical protein